MTSTLPPVANTAGYPMPTIVEVADPHFGANVSQSSIHQVEQSIASVTHHPVDAIIPSGRIEGGSIHNPQEVTLVTQQNLSQHPLEQGNVMESIRLSERGSGRAVLPPAVEVPVVYDSRLRQAEAGSLQQTSIVVPPVNLPAPIINSAYTANLPSNPGVNPSLIAVREETISGGSLNAGSSRLQPQSQPGIQLTEPFAYNFSRGSALAHTTVPQLSEAQRRVFQESQQPHRSRVPMNKLADWS